MFILLNIFNVHSRHVNDVKEDIIERLDEIKEAHVVSQYLHTLSIEPDIIIKTKLTPPTLSLACHSFT